MFDLMQYALIFYDFQLILAQMPFFPVPSPLANPLLTRPVAAGTPHYVMAFGSFEDKLVGRDYLAACWHEV